MNRAYESILPSRIRVPQHAHPLVRWLFGQLAQNGVTYRGLERASGVKSSSVKAWRGHNRPGLDSIHAACRVLEHDTLPVPCAEVLPAELQRELQALGQKHGLSRPFEAFVAVAAASGPEVAVAS